MLIYRIFQVLLGTILSFVTWLDISIDVRFSWNNKEKDIQLSKSLSWFLRHGALSEGEISEEGYVTILSLLAHKTFKKYNFGDVERVVNNNEKQRFKLRCNPLTKLWEIKANQGHSIQLITNAELTPILEPKYSTVIHGTYLLNWHMIKDQGLSRMRRKHIHFAKGLNVISGIRKGVQVLIYIDLAKALKDGLKFFESENGVILTEGDANGYLKPEYFLKVINIQRLGSGEHLYP